MVTIKIIQKSQGSGLMRLNDGPWDNLTKLEGGTFSDLNNIIELTTTTGLKATIDKNSIHDANDKIISYRGEVHQLGGPIVLLDQVKATPNKYVLRGFNPYNSMTGEFFLFFEIEGEIQNKQDAVEGLMKKKRLNSQQLGFLSVALMKNLFPKPKLGELLVQEGFADSSCVLYFELHYYKKLVGAINAAYQKGSFATSNSENDWNDLMYAIESATIESKVEKEKLKHYFLSDN